MDTYIKMAQNAYDRDRKALMAYKGSDRLTLEVLLHNFTMSCGYLKGLMDAKNAQSR